MRRTLAFVAGFSAVSSVAAVGASIWTAGDLSSRLGGTGALLFVVAVATGLVAALWGEL